MAWSEARIVRQRNANSRKLDAVLMQGVVHSLLSKDAGKAHRKLIERLDESE